jgi:hypothetical protein
MTTPADEGIRAARRDALPWTYSDNGLFRKLPPVATFRDGQPVWMTECEEYIEGRWEGFVSIAPREDKQ